MASCCLKPPPKVPLPALLEFVHALELEKAHSKTGEIALNLMNVDLIVLDELVAFPLKYACTAL